MTTLAQLHDCHGCNDERSIVQKKRELGVAQAWLSLSARKTRSREERESFMKGRHTPKTEEAFPSGLGRAA